MLSFFKNQPFAVEAFFKHSIVLTFSFPKEKLEMLIPPCLQLDVFADKWAFIAVALVQTHNLRPKGFPELLGNDFVLIGYRIFVTYINKAGKRLRGLYIIKSETNKIRMELLGNLFTRYSYTTTDINYHRSGEIWEINSKKSRFNIQIDTSKAAVDLPANSPFANWKIARRFAGPLPFTFNYNNKTKEVLIIEGVRENWTPRPVRIIDYNILFINSVASKEGILANAFIIEDIPYHWKKGRTEKWG